MKLSANINYYMWLLIYTAYKYEEVRFFLKMSWPQNFLLKTLIIIEMKKWGVGQVCKIFHQADRTHTIGQSIILIFVICLLLI